MNWLLLGHSEIAKKRVIPALKKCGIKRIDIASKSRLDDVRLPNGMVAGCFYQDYEEAIKDSKAGIVYISTINSLHAPLAELAVKIWGFHTVSAVYPGPFSIFPE